MAIDPRISMGIQVPNAGNAINIFENALNSATNRGIATNQDQRAQALAPFKQQQAQQTVDMNQQTLDQNRDVKRLTNLHQTGQLLKPFIDNQDFAGGEKFLLDNIANIQQRIASGETDLDTAESMQTLAQWQSGDIKGVLGNINAVAGLVNGNRGVSLGQKEFETLTQLAQGDPNSDTTKAARIKLRLDPGAVGSSTQTIAGSPELTEQVATSEATIAGAKAGATEGEKLKQQRKHKPAISKEVKLAEAEAKERGDVLTDVQRMEASLPGVKEVVSELVELSSIATSTFTGRLFDSAVKESGFGSTKGANAKAKLISIVDNQVLPLLKETFGAAFTVQEGDNLKASLVDPNASPSQKRAQLDAFIAQKERNLRTKQAQLSLGQQQPQQAVEFQEGARATNPSTGEVVVFTNNEWVVQ